MNLDYYQYIATTAECGSISKAAEKLHLRQQNLSGTIRKVEQYYGITIFTRDVKGITLTKDGEYFLEKIRQILAIADELEQTHLYPSKRHYANVVDHITLYMPDMLSSGLWIQKIKEFNNIFPYVELSMLCRPAKEALQLALQDEKSIVALNVPFFATDFLSQLPATLIATEVPSKINYTAITRKENPEANTLKQISVDELLEKKLVLHSNVALEENIFYRLLKYYGEPKIQYVMDNTSLYLDFMNTDNYWSLARETQNNRYNLKTIPLVEDFYSTVQIIRHKSTNDSFIIQTLIKMLSEL